VTLEDILFSQAAALELGCSHRFCRGCLAKCAVKGMSACPLCRRSHLLDPAELWSRCRDYRLKYRSWRNHDSDAFPLDFNSITKPSQETAPNLLASASVGLIC